MPELLPEQHFESGSSSTTRMSRFTRVLLTCAGDDPKFGERAGLRLDVYRPSTLLELRAFFHTIDPSGHAGLIGI
jgi:hypothetical protein